MAHANLGRYNVYRGEPALALPHLYEALYGILRLGQKGVLGASFESIGEAALLLGDLERAVRLLAAATVLRETIGAPPRGTTGDRTAESLGQLEARLGPDRFQLAWSDGAAMTIDQAVAYARELNELESGLRA
jgi:hypothetical protein